MALARVLYIEDKPDNRLLVRRVLMAEDIDVIEAPDAEQGIAIARSERPDLILMDINMPGKDGFMATNDIRQMPELNHIPIVALTANVMKGDKERSIDAGCDGYIPKPIDVDRFPFEVMGFIRKGRS
jgi:two-component system, cell cycle response regulator DivK